MNRVFKQFEDDLPVDINKRYYFKDEEYCVDTGFTEIHKLCLFPEKLREYLEQKAGSIEIHTKTTSGITPLMIAVMNNVYESVKLLLDYSLVTGIDINIQNIIGMNALMLACDKNIECVKLLLEYRADINKFNVLEQACYKFNTKIIKLLLEYGADINIQNNRGNTSLHILCLKYCNNDEGVKCIQLLLEYGADVDIKNNDGRTALHYVCQNGNTNNCIKCINLLLSYGANPKMKDYYGYTPSILTNYIRDNKVKSKVIKLLNSNVISTSKKILLNINRLSTKKLTHFDYNSILLYELKRCIT